MSPTSSDDIIVWSVTEDPSSLICSNRCQKTLSLSMFFVPLAGQVVEKCHPQLDSGSASSLVIIGQVTDMAAQNHLVLPSSRLQELEQQALIYNYIEAGLAVPPHLVLPIWKSFAGYLSSVNGACLQQQYFANCECQNPFFITLMNFQSGSIFAKI
ncbi:hypothetical protein HYC85_026646 [Camellia sinensis]|uniref:Growth-regulating factor n=1 Tax=Camellia sinensis TaxID=4442 RepID=A0A7J7G4M9_CAMSI|nr:hypothetical protein HYC85_026646 [Camellia sinensis]